MNKSGWAALTLAALTTTVTLAQDTPLESTKDKVSYAIGLDIGKNLKAQDIEADPTTIARGIKDALGDAKPLLTDEQIREIFTTFQAELQAKRAERMKVEGEKNLKEGAAFLEANKAKEGVKTLPSGLQYKEITPGTGATPKATDNVTTHYKGTLIDGTEFDSSYKRGEPATFPVNGVIKGWTEALQLMKEGGKWQLFIPAELAYGEQGRPGIPPNSVLLFDIELVKVGGEQ